MTVHDIIIECSVKNKSKRWYEFWKPRREEYKFTMPNATVEFGNPKTNKDGSLNIVATAPMPQKPIKIRRVL